MSSTTATEPLCSAWITGADVVACGPDDLGVGSDVTLLDDAAYDASAILYTLTGRRFPGVCEATVRPCRETCGCWGAPGVGSPLYGDWRWGYDSIAGWRYYTAGGRELRSCGCGADEVVLFAGYPVLEVLEVKIDGDVADPATYALREQRKLWRLDDPGPPVSKRKWPGCQNVTLPDTEPGTFSITYTWGGNPTPLGGMAASQLARELYKACNPGAGACGLPAGVTKVVRQGTTYERTVAFAKALAEGASGLPIVDAFIASTNPTQARRRPAVWSPDRKRFPRPV